MIRRRRLVFQLTPLLDLMLIVIFAQYLEVQLVATKTVKDAARQADEQTAAALKAKEEAEAKLAAMMKSDTSLEGQLRRQLSDLTEEMQKTLNQRKDLAALVAGLFQIPQEVLDKALAGGERTPEEQRQLREMVNALADEHYNDVIKHLVTHQAMRKRVDVWTLFIESDGMAHLKVGDETKSFPVRDRASATEAERLANLSPREQALALRKAETEAADAFAQRLFKAYQTLPQPKSIVVLVVSWKGDLERYYREPAREGLDVTLRLFNTTSDRTQFIPAILGAELE
jgi:hypothetical protein